MLWFPNLFPRPSGPVVVPPFAQQRLVCIALIIAMAVMAAVFALVLEPGQLLVEPLASQTLVTINWVAGVVALLAAVTVRIFFRSRAEAAKAEDRAKWYYLSSIVPIAILEGGFMLGMVSWVLTGETLPALAFASLQFVFALSFVPLTDPNKT